MIHQKVNFQRIQYIQEIMQFQWKLELQVLTDMALQTSDFLQDFLYSIFTF